MSTIGVDIGGTKTIAVRLDGPRVATSDYRILDPKVDTITAIAESVGAVIDASVTAIGVGIAGLVSVQDRRFVWGPHVTGTDLAVGDAIEERFALPVFVDNDANTALHAELEIGVATGYRDVLLVTLGTGIGGAIAIGGELYRGGSFAGEWGHIRIEVGGLLCDCGKRGCWETRASGPALERLAREVAVANPASSLLRAIGDEPITGPAVTRAADAGDETARALVTEVGRAFGQGLADLTAIFDPQLIVVGGGLGSVGESILGPARRVLADALHGGNHRIAPTVLVAHLGADAGAIGAALLAAGGDHGTRHR
jgi:glucokinase